MFSQHSCIARNLSDCCIVRLDLPLLLRCGACVLSLSSGLRLLQGLRGESDRNGMAMLEADVAHSHKLQPSWHHVRIFAKRTRIVDTAIMQARVPHAPHVRAHANTEQQFPLTRNIFANSKYVSLHRAEESIKGEL